MGSVLQPARWRVALDLGTGPVEQVIDQVRLRRLRRRVGGHKMLAAARRRNGGSGASAGPHIGPQRQLGDVSAGDLEIGGDMRACAFALLVTDRAAGGSLARLQITSVR